MKTTPDKVSEGKPAYGVRNTPNGTWFVVDTTRNVGVLKSVTPQAKYNAEIARKAALAINNHDKLVDSLYSAKIQLEFLNADTPNCTTEHEIKKIEQLLHTIKQGE